ncbi:MAG: glutamate-5-semialdehyde dehydrogenase [Acidimicrobiia bacterium]
MMEQIGHRARMAARSLAPATPEEKNVALEAMAGRLEESAAEVLAANAQDLERASAEGTGGALIDRLRLDEERLAGMAGGLRKVAALPDPVGQITGGWRLPNGVRLQRVRVPLGVVAVIYEARPNVTADAAGLCLKSGNAVILRGSSHALQSNLAIGQELQAGLASVGMPVDALQVMEDTSREMTQEVMRSKQWVDLLVPRGGPGLIASIQAEATVPYVIDGAGNCHVYVDAAADLEKARRIVMNAKVQRPGVCNAAETLLVHEQVADKFLTQAAAELEGAGVELRGDSLARALVPSMGEATDEDWATEFLDLVLAVRVVADLEEAIEHIRRYGTGHTEAIITEDRAAADRFVAGTDSAVVMVNASTRFTDGEEFGFGAEIGISTQKLHVRGPMGLEALTTQRYLLYGDGQVR